MSCPGLWPLVASESSSASWCVGYIPAGWKRFSTSPSSRAPRSGQETPGFIYPDFLDPTLCQIGWTAGWVLGVLWSSCCLILSPGCSWGNLLFDRIEVQIQTLPERHSRDLVMSPFRFLPTLSVTAQSILQLLCVFGPLCLWSNTNVSRCGRRSNKVPKPARSGPGVSTFLTSDWQMRCLRSLKPSQITPVSGAPGNKGN